MDEQPSIPLNTPPIVTPPPEPKENWFLKHVGLLSIVSILLLVVVAGSVYWWKEIRQADQLQQQAATDEFADLEVNGSAEYKSYVESINKIGDQWGATEAQMKTQGSSTEDIELAKRDFFEFFATTLLLKIKFEETALTDREKLAIGSKLQDLAKDINIDLSVDPGCEYTEQKLPAQDFFVGATLKFKKPMVYIEWPEEQKKYCSPIMSSTRYWIQSTESSGSFAHYDEVKTHPIDPSTTFTVEGRVKLHNRGLFGGEDRDHYILKDSKGEITVPAFFYVFDQDYKGQTADDGEIGSELYKDGKLIGHIVSDIKSGGVWIQGTQVPQEVIDANTPKKATSWPTTTAKRTEFMERIMFAVDEGKLVNYTSKELIDYDLGKDLYTYNNGEVIHDLGGRVYVKKNNDLVSVVFENIPKGEQCYEFYYINDPELFGFGESFINGVLENSGGTTQSINEFKQKVCYPATGMVTIEFRGSISSIKADAKSWRAQYTPKY
jgi:hypothetical protein